MKKGIKRGPKKPQDKQHGLEVAIEKNRTEMSLKSMQFNRFMLIRYATAFFLFVNLYWAIIMWQTLVALIPVALMFIASLAIIEQIKLFGHHTNQLIYSKVFFRSQLIVNIILMVSIPTSLFTFFYQFIQNTGSNRLVVLILLLLSSSILLIVNKRLGLIATNHDKYYARLTAYQSVLKNNKEIK